jgi:hypothetical protein
MSQLKKEQILAASLRLKEVEVPEWGGSVFIRPVTLEEQGKLADLGAKHEKSSAAARIRHCTPSLLQWTVCDEDGKSLFTTEDLAGLISKSSASASLRLQDAVLKFSGLTEESRRELEKNLLTGPTVSAKPHVPDQIWTIGLVSGSRIIFGAYAKKWNADIYEAGVYHQLLADGQAFSL